MNSSLISNSLLIEKMLLFSIYSALYVSVKTDLRVIKLHNYKVGRKANLAYKKILDEV